MNSIIISTYNNTLKTYINGNYSEHKRCLNQLNLLSLSLYIKNLFKDSRNIESIYLILQDEINRLNSNILSQL